MYININVSPYIFKTYNTPSSLERDFTLGRTYKSVKLLSYGKEVPFCFEVSIDDGGRGYYSVYLTEEKDGKKHVKTTPLKRGKAFPRKICTKRYYSLDLKLVKRKNAPKAKKDSRSND